MLCWIQFSHIETSRCRKILRAEEQTSNSKYRFFNTWSMEMVLPPSRLRLRTQRQKVMHYLTVCWRHSKNSTSCCNHLLVSWYKERLMTWIVWNEPFAGDKGFSNENEGRQRNVFSGAEGLSYRNNDTIRHFSMFIVSIVSSNSLAANSGL